MKDPLIFIDANIFLDFYRAAGRDTKLSILDLIDSNHDRIITGEQVEMEYKKNRHAVIVDAIKSLPKPGQPVGQIPAFLREGEAVQEIDQKWSAIKEQIKKVKMALEQAIFEPSKHDPIYQSLEKLFVADCNCHLTRANAVRDRVRSLAHERFTLGYPPRKASDTSCGDAVNWEWIISCANDSKNDVIIVSRDSDYGCTVGTKPVLNDWLCHEFASRVKNAQQIILMDRLTAAFKEAGITVSAEQDKEEAEIIEERAKAFEKIPIPFASDFTGGHPSLSFAGPYDQSTLCDWSTWRGRFIREGTLEKPEEQIDTDE